MKNLFPKIVWLAWMIAAEAIAQEPDSLAKLTLEQAFDFALENNLEIKAQSKSVEIAENNVYPGRAGLLPTVSLIGDATYANNSSDVTIRTFQENPPQVNFDENGVETQTISAVVQADYVFFAGFSGKYRYKLLQDEQSLARYQQEALINNTVLAVAEIFLEVAKLQRREELLVENLAISQQRLDKVRDQFQFGKATGLLVLRAESDVNQDYNALDNIRLVKNNLIKDLNFLMGLAPESTYEVAIDYNLPALQSSEEIRQTMLSQNPELKLSQKGVELANHQLSVSQASRYPSVSGFANYGYFRQENDVQQLAEIQNLGFTLGISLRYNLFNGNQAKRDIENAKINTETSRIRQTQLEDKLYNQAIKELSNLQLLQAQLAREEQNLKTFQENFSRTEERYFTGKATSLEVRDAQIALLNAQITINDLEVDILQTSLRLEKLKGTLLENQ